MIGYLARSKDEIIRVKMLLSKLNIAHEHVYDKDGVKDELLIEAGPGVNFMKNIYNPTFKGLSGEGK